MVDANCVFIVNDDDVVVVDAPEASAALDRGTGAAHRQASPLRRQHRTGTTIT